jgi:homoserine O-acetyltransferase
MTTLVADIETKAFTTRDFRLQSGDVLPEVTIAYRTMGELSQRRDNVVLVTHGNTSGPQMIDPGGSTGEGAWNEIVGPGKAVDTVRYFAICPNMLGSSYGSTNAASIDVRTGKRYGPRFPGITVSDIVATQRRLLDHLGIDKMVAIVGPSYGGFQALQWAVNYPDAMRGIAAVVTAPSVPPERSDAKTYGIETRLRDTMSDPAQIEAAIREEAARWARGFDANSLLILARALRSFDVIAELGKIKARVLYVLSRTDRLFPPEIAPRVMAAFKAAGVDADYFLLDSDYGHTASGRDWAKWTPRLREFMESL